MTASATTTRHVHAEEVMGTVVSFDVRGHPDPGEALMAASSWLHGVDATFSNYRCASEISRIGRGELRAEHSSVAVQAVLARCEQLRRMTRGAFDVHVSGTLDPSGYVKGWAAEGAARILEGLGLEHFQINAGGDIVVRGDALPDRGWRIGIRHPDRVDAFAGVAHLHGGAIATSGAYERGGHVRDPRTGAPARGLRSVTVAAADLATADAWATAVFALGGDGPDLLAAAPAGLEAFVIRAGTTLQTAGFPWPAEDLDAFKEH